MHFLPPVLFPEVEMSFNENATQHSLASLPSAAKQAKRAKKQSKQTEPAAPPLLISVTEARKRLGIGNSLAWKLVSEGKLPTIRLGRRVLVSVDALQALIAQAGAQ
jgi:excisionase family DNA binding protein